MRQEFLGSSIQVLAPVDLGVFKALFDRRKDWVDIETMIESRDDRSGNCCAPSLAAGCR